MSPGAQPGTPEPLSSPDWLLAGFEAQRDQFQFARVSRQTYAQSAFLDHRIRPRPEEVLSASGDEVDAVIAALDGPPAACIFHTAFCASTLLANCLDFDPGTLVLREPLVLSRLADLNRASSLPSTPDFERLRHRVIRLLDRAYSAEPVVVKPSNFANTLIPAYLNTGPGNRRCILLSNGLNSLLVSVLKKRGEAETSLPGFTQALLADSDYVAQVDLQPVSSLALLQQAVVFWHCQRYQFQRIRQSAPAGQVLPLSTHQFLHQPLETLMEVNEFFRLGATQEQLDQVVQSGAFRQHSKKDSEYGPEQQRREAAETSREFAAEIRSALRWADALLQKLPVEPMTGDEDPLD